MKNSITIRIASKKALILSFFSVLIIVLLAAKIVLSINYTTNQTILITGILSLVIIIAYAINKKKSRIIHLSFGANALQISENDEILNDFSYDKIYNYNLYYFLLKKLGCILRVNFENKNYYYYIVGINFSKFSSIDKENIEKLNKNLNDVKSDSKSSIFQDYLIQLIGAVPVVLFFVSILLFIGSFVYIMFYLKGNYKNYVM